MEVPIEFRCPDCQCVTTLVSSSSHGPKMYFLPNRCGHCGADNPDALKDSRDEWEFSVYEQKE